MFFFISQLSRKLEKTKKNKLFLKFFNIKIKALFDSLIYVQFKMSQIKPFFILKIYNNKHIFLVFSEEIFYNKQKIEVNTT